MNKDMDGKKLEEIYRGVSKDPVIIQEGFLDRLGARARGLGAATKTYGRNIGKGLGTIIHGGTATGEDPKAAARQAQLVSLVTAFFRDVGKVLGQEVQSPIALDPARKEFKIINAKEYQTLKPAAMPTGGPKQQTPQGVTMAQPEQQTPTIGGNISAPVTKEIGRPPNLQSTARPSFKRGEAVIARDPKGQMVYGWYEGTDPKTQMAIIKTKTKGPVQVKITTIKRPSSAVPPKIKLPKLSKPQQGD